MTDQSWPRRGLPGGARMRGTVVVKPAEDDRSTAALPAAPPRRYAAPAR